MVGWVKQYRKQKRVEQERDYNQCGDGGRPLNHETPYELLAPAHRGFSIFKESNMEYRALAVFKVAAVRDLGEGHRAINLKIQPNDRFKDEYEFEMQAGEEITVYVKTPEAAGVFDLGAIVEMKIEPEFKI